MRIDKRNNNQQLWKEGNIITDGFDYYMIVFDNSTEKFRLLSPETGNILVDEYDSIAEIKKMNGELNPAQHANISVSW